MNERRHGDVVEHESLAVVASLIKDVRDQQTTHMKETAEYRRNNDLIINAHADSLDSQSKSIEGLRETLDKFIKCFDTNYAPSLRADIERRQWWGEIYQTQKKRSVLVVTGVIAVAAMFGLGSSVLFLIKKFNVFMGSMIP